MSELIRPLSRKPGLVDTSELHVTAFDEASSTGAEALAGSGAGLDHFAGERILAAAFLRDTPKGHEHRLACAITDRRTAIAGWSSISGPATLDRYRFTLPHGELRHVEVKSSMLANYVRLHGATAKQELPFAEAVPMLGAFYQTLAQRIPPQHRVEPPTPFISPTDEDPTGAVAASRSLWTDDPDARRMLEVVARGAREGALTADVGRDLVGRVVLAHRSRAGGPGMHEGRWMSPMSSQDFGHTLIRIFGQPVAHTQPQPGVDQLDFRIDPRRDPVGNAVTALGVASYVGLGIGFSPGKAIANALMKRKQVTELRVLFADGPVHTAFRLLAPMSNLEQHDARMAHALHQALIATSYQVLDRRCRSGWRASYHELLAVPAA